MSWLLLDWLLLLLLLFCCDLAQHRIVDEWNYCAAKPDLAQSRADTGLAFRSSHGRHLRRCFLRSPTGLTIITRD